MGSWKFTDQEAIIVELQQRLSEVEAERDLLKEIIGTYDGDGVSADCSLAIATLQSETGGEVNYSRADREIHDALARGVDAGRQVTQLLADQERMREALVKWGKHPATCPKGVGLGYYVPRVDAVCNCGIDAALSPPRQPKESLPHA